MKKVILGDIVDIERNSIAPEKIEDGTIFVGLENIDNEGNFISLGPTSNGDIASNKFKFDYRHLLYGKLRPYLKKIARPNFEGICSTDILPLKPINELIDRDFLFYYLRQPDMIKLATERCSGANLPRLSPDQLIEFPITLPGLEEQKRIVAILDKADAMRKKRQETIRLADEFLRSVFLEMFGDPVRNEKGWEVVKLEKLLIDKNGIVDGPFGASVDTKVDYVEDGEIPVIRTKNVVPFKFITEDLKFMTREKFETVKRSQVLPGDIILTKVGTIGNACFFPDTYPEAVLSTTGSCRIRLNEMLINKKYFLYFLYLYRPVMQKIASAAVQAFLNLNHIKNFNVVLPSIELQNKFVAICDGIEEKKGKLKESLIKIETVNSSLVTKAFRGEL